MKEILLIICSLFLLCPHQGDACTGIRLIARDGSIIHGRTLEFGVKLPTAMIVVPRGYAFTGTSPLGDGLAYMSKYGFIGAIVFDNMAALDGINEKGLSVGTFFFPGYAEYTTMTKENQMKALSPSDFPNWILSQYASVDEVKEALSSVVIAPTVEQGWGDTPAPFHYIVYDVAGNCMVIEPIGGSLRIYDNKLGVLTNSPSFEWHMTNLRNFINLRAEDVPPKIIDTLTFAPFGQGSGMVGLVGDFTPPSRFVRAVIFSHAALPLENSTETVFQTFHILNLFDIPKGVSRGTVDGKILSLDSTWFTCVRDPKGLKFYYKTYADQSIKMIDLKKFDLNAKIIKKISTEGIQTVVDVSGDLR
jgi:choloylglycine hydrolase